MREIQGGRGRLQPEQVACVTVGRPCKGIKASIKPNAIVAATDCIIDTGEQRALQAA